jgi:sulfonate transport system substrate-binding protein
MNRPTPTRAGFLRTASAVAASAGIATAAPLRAAAAEPATLNFAYAYTVPTTLVLKEKGWLEEVLKPRGIGVNWILSLGSNKTLEFLRSRSADFGSAAASAGLLGRSNGTPVKLLYFNLRGESTGLLVRSDSSLKTIADLKGKKIAATRGTEPYIFTLRALQKNGIDESDVEIVPLQHPDGRAALETGRVDAWAGLDPDLSEVLVERRARFLYRDTSLITGGALFGREEFVSAYPDLTALVLRQSDRARAYIHQHPDETVALYVKASGLEPAIAKAVLARGDIDHPAIVPDDYARIAGAGPILKSIGAIPTDTDVVKTTADLLAPAVYAKLGSGAA